ncbi:stomatal closure-related actin-binding protein [Trifolium repens]|nr:stomatal closure-related actin-binding protein [Trifolium repens]
MTTISNMKCSLFNLHFLTCVIDDPIGFLKLNVIVRQRRGRVAGRNKDDVEDAIAMVEALAVQLTQREGELIQEKAEVKRLENFLKKFTLSMLRVWIHFQISEDAKKLVDEERAFARSEIDNVRAAVQRVTESLQEHERVSQASGKQELEESSKR